MVSYHKGGAVSPFSIHVKNLSEFENEEEIERQLDASKIEWVKKIKAVK
jgi:hypothetical protein